MKKSDMTIIDRLEFERPGFLITHPDMPGFSVSATDQAGMEELLNIIVATKEYNRTGSTSFRSPRVKKKTTLRFPSPPRERWG